MRGRVVVAIAFGCAAIAGCGESSVSVALDAIAPEVLDGHLAFLSGDRLEGRAPGTRGSQLAAQYIATQFQLAGLEPPVGDSSYFQLVELISAIPRTSLSFRARGGALFNPEYGTEYVAWSSHPVDSLRVQGELVFVGYGISAPEYGWDDYGEADVRGKVVLILVNDPGQDDPNRFRGDTVTRYGRWTYKLEEAAGRGVAGALLIHDDRRAGYGWNVIRASRFGPQASLAAAGSDSSILNGWLSGEAAEHVLSMAGLEFGTLIESARSEDFRAIATGVSVSARLRNRLRPFTDVNVAGLLPGGDPELAGETVVVTAHYDHLGVGPEVDGDSIYNGAYDNASGAALLLSLAEAFGRLEPPPGRSVLFLALTAEESGLLGSKHYVDEPILPLEATVANINVDGVNLWGRTEDVAAIGAESSSLESVLADAALSERLVLTRDRAPEHGRIYRSAQYNFMLAGVPAAYIAHGIEFVGQLPGWGEQMLEDYLRSRYHQPSDEYWPEIDYSGAVQQGRVTFRVILTVAGGERPEWSGEAGSRF